jgi:type III secretion protein U
MGDVGHLAPVRRLHSELAVQRVVTAHRRLAAIHSETTLLADLSTNACEPRQPALPPFALVLVRIVQGEVKALAAFEPLKPDMKRLNPMEGFKRIFSFRNGVDFGLVLVRSCIWFIAAGVVMWWALPAILMSPTCELPCVATTGLDLIRTLMIIAIIMLIVVGLIDLPLQTFMFLREQKMSKTEFKREMKEEQGAPEFVGHRKEQHKSFAAGGGVTGVRGMTLVFASSDHVVAIRFDQNSEPVPIIVAKGTGTHGDSILDTAQAMQVPVEADPMVARELSLVGIGGMVPERLFGPVAMALVRHRKAG